MMPVCMLIVALKIKYFNKPKIMAAIKQAALKEIGDFLITFISFASLSKSQVSMRQDCGKKALLQFQFTMLLFRLDNGFIVP